MTFRVLLALLVASGCAQTQKITANGCEVVAYQTIGGGNGYTSGIHYPEGRFRNFAEFALIDDQELIRQRNWGISTDQQQFCAIQEHLRVGLAMRQMFGRSYCIQVLLNVQFINNGFN